jgi:hypothetical protein
MGRLFLLRYWRDLLLGAGAGALAGLAVLAAGEGLGGLGPLLGGSWLHVHAAAILPGAIAGGIVLALAGPGAGLKTSGWVLGWLSLGGLVNGLLEAGGALAALLQGGVWVAPLVFGFLGLPAVWLALKGLARIFLPSR